MSIMLYGLTWTPEHGNPPSWEPPIHTVWDSEWLPTTMWDTSMADDHPGVVGWIREALELDDHEECCHHVRYITYIPGEHNPEEPPYKIQHYFQQELELG